MSINLLGANFFFTILYIVLAVFVLLLMVLIHELGHYVAGRMLHFKIEEFSVGFGKKLISRKNKRGETISLRIFPLGGFCAFEGEDADEQTAKSPTSFTSQKPWKRMIVLAMGAIFNFLSAIIFSFILLVGFGYDVKQASNVDEYSINDIQQGDVIYYIGGKKVDFAFGDTTENLLAEYQLGEKFNITVKRDGQMMDIEVEKYQATDEVDGAFVPRVDSDGNPIAVLGVNLKPYKYGFGEALGRCVPMAVGFAWLVLKTLWLLITFRLPIKSIGGPITTISTIASYSQINIANLFIMLPMIAANLAAFNLLPFPALDGAHIAFTGIEWIRKKPINRRVENAIHTGGLIFLLAFVVIVDIIQVVT